MGVYQEKVSLIDRENEGSTLKSIGSKNTGYPCYGVIDVAKFDTTIECSYHTHVLLSVKYPYIQRVTGESVLERVCNVEVKKRGEKGVIIY